MKGGGSCDCFQTNDVDRWHLQLFGFIVVSEVVTHALAKIRMSCASLVTLYLNTSKPMNSSDRRKERARERERKSIGQRTNGQHPSNGTREEKRCSSPVILKSRIFVLEINQRNVDKLIARFSRLAESKEIMRVDREFNNRSVRAEKFFRTNFRSETRAVGRIIGRFFLSGCKSEKSCPNR